jgi:hypothetical protein
MKGRAAGYWQRTRKAAAHIQIKKKDPKHALELPKSSFGHSEILKKF